jgi:TDG/mug DNA glycosylase family protein
MPYDQRQRIVCERRIAVWDVLRECVRKGRLDAAIRRDSEMPNDFGSFLRQHPQIRAIFFNGQKADAAFRRHVLADVMRLGRDLRYRRLPSTSPAHAGRTFEEKLAAWQAVRQALEGKSRRA